jgi:hypothetical protein
MGHKKKIVDNTSASVTKQKKRKREVENWQRTSTLGVKRHLRLVEKIYFINDSSTKYASVAIHPGKNYAALIEIGKICGTYVTLTPATWHILLEYLKTDMSDHIDNVVSLKNITFSNVKYLCITSMNVSIRLSMDEVDNLRQCSNCLSSLLTKYETSQHLIQAFCKSFNRDRIHSVDHTESHTLYTMLCEELKMYPDLPKP